MKWLFIFPALIAASWVVMASQSSLAFELAQGVIVDGKGSVVYLMNPGGGIDAVNLSGGTVLATTTRGAKPFEMTELEARIRAHLRRANFHQPTVVECGALVFDSNGRQFTLAGEPLALTAREHAVLEALILRAGSTVSKASLTTTVFGFDDEANPNAIEIYVHRVRKKLVGSDISIVTLRGLGYVLKAVNAD